MPKSDPLNDLRNILRLDTDRSTKAKHIAEAIRVSGGYRWVGIYDVDCRRGLVSNVAWSGPSPPAYPTFPISKGITGRVITQRKTVNVGDVADDADYLTALGSTRAEIIIPVFRDSTDEVVGTIDVESEQLNAFDSEAQKLLEDSGCVVASLWR